MKIYTRTGDNGTTALFGGKRVSKSDPQVRAYGAIDELSSFVGLIIAKNAKEKELLTLIQKDLYFIMAYLAGSPSLAPEIETRLGIFEKTIDSLSSHSPKITRFILPQGTEISTLYHIARTVCRRSERDVVGFSNKNNTISQLKNQIVIKYLNRLSDLFFAFSRTSNQKEITV